MLIGSFIKLILLTKACVRGWFSSKRRGLAVLLAPCGLLCVLHWIGSVFRTDYLLADRSYPALLWIAFCISERFLIMLYSEDAQSRSFYAKSVLPMSPWPEYLARLFSGMLFLLVQCVLLFLFGSVFGAVMRVPSLWITAAVLVAVVFHDCMACAVSVLLPPGGRTRYGVLLLSDAVLLSGVIVNEGIFSESLYAVWKWTVTGSFKHLFRTLSESSAQMRDWLVPGAYALLALGASLLFLKRYRRAASQE